MIKRLLILPIVISLIVYPFVFKTDAIAASLTSMTDTMSRLAISASSNHKVTFTLGGSTSFDAGETIVLNFNDSFNTTALANTDPLDYDIVVGATEETVVAAGCGATDQIEITSINNGTATITFTACASYTAEAAGSVISIEIGSNATVPSTGDSQIANPGTSGTKTLAITAASDTGSLAQPIMDSDQVTVTAAVDPTITSDLTPGAAPYTCALGTLDAAAVNGCEITNTVSTNATSGYSTTILENGNLCSPSVAVCTNSINDVADSDIVAGTEEYGVSTTDTDATGITANYDGVACGGATENASAITGAAQIYADEISAIASDATTLCYAASITATSPSGSYSHITTHITTGNF